jgi:hypothetical protein
VGVLFIGSGGMGGTELRKVMWVVTGSSVLSRLG